MKNKKHDICLTLYSRTGAVLYENWYVSMASALHAKYYHTVKVWQEGAVWVIWRFDTMGRRLLLNSSRPLPFLVVEPASFM